MKNFRLLALISVLSLAFFMFAACDPESTPEETTAGEEETVSGEEDTTAEEETEDLFALQSEKIGSTDYTVHIADSGIYYTDENGKYGVMTFDGKEDTGAIYDFCAPEGPYYTVVSTIPGEAMQPSELNCKGLIDVNGEEIIPAEYASFNVLNDRYVRVYRITGLTADETEALLDNTDNSFSITFAEGNQLYKGEWQIYDMVSGSIIEGISGTKPSTVTAYGNYIKYTDDDGKQYTVNSEKKELPAGAMLFDNGFYTLTNKNKTTLYDTDGNELFTVGKKDHKPVKCEGEYFFAEKSGNAEDKYVYLDKTGAPVSGTFSAEPDFNGNYTVINNKIYDFNGNQVFEDEYKQVYYDDVFGRGYFLRNEDNYTLVKNDSTVIETFTDDDAISISQLGFVVTKREDNGINHYYSVKDEEYILTGYILDSWLVEREVSSGIFEIIDVYTGEAILSGYKDYITVPMGDNTMYVYAKTETGIYDIYTIS